MSTLSLLTHKLHHHPGAKVIGRGEADEGTWTEWAWCSLTFLLFLALGPFSAVPAMIGALSLVGRGDEPPLEQH